jgi:MFS family permease
MITKEEYRVVKITAIGGALEFYDFTIYALFAPYISQHFFANANHLIGLINTFAVFTLGYFARPLGGIVFGHLGDKLGRKSAFSLAIFIMATATLLMGCLPSYQTMGVMAPTFLIVLRLIQGFSVGGEIPGAAVFIMEHIPREKRGFSIGLVFMCITLGNTLGAGVGLVLTRLLSQEQMMAWGWRIPFIIGFFLGIISYIIRQRMIETPAFIAMQKEEKIQRIPFFNLLKFLRIKLLKAFLLTAVTSSIISLFLYLPTYLATILKVNMSHAYLINSISFLSFALMTAFFGWVSDYVNRNKLLMIGALLLLLFSYPLFYGLTTGGEQFIWVFILAISFFGGMINGSYVVLITESFPANLRYSGMGFSYSLGVAVFGGIAPLAFTSLTHYLAVSEAPALYLLACATLTLMAIVSYTNAEKIKSDAKRREVLPTFSS